jgi:hypothetical protein
MWKWVTYALSCLGDNKHLCNLTRVIFADTKSSGLDYDPMMIGTKLTSQVTLGMRLLIS